MSILRLKIRLSVISVIKAHNFDTRFSLLDIDSGSYRSITVAALVLSIIYYGQFCEMFKLKKPQDTRLQTQDSRFRDFGFHSLKYYYQNRTEDNHSDSDNLRYCQAVKFKGIVIAQKFNKKSCDTVNNKHQSKG